jgi:hypothetical protein
MSVSLDILNNTFGGSRHGIFCANDPRELGHPRALRRCLGAGHHGRRFDVRVSDLSKWSADYGAKAGANVKYQSIGSRGGIAQIKSSAVDFGATDAPLKPDDLQKSGLGQFPLVIGGIVPVLNVEGVKPGELKFTGPLLADIFLGKVKM